MRNVSSNILKSIPILLLLLAAFYGSNSENEKAPEVLQDILDNFENDVLHSFSIRVPEGTGEMNFHNFGFLEDGSYNDILLSTYLDENFPIQGLGKYAVFWVNVNNSQVELKLFDPSNNQVHSFPVEVPSGLNLDLLGNHSVWGRLEGEDLVGLTVTGLFDPNNTPENSFDDMPKETYYINLNTLKVENYYRYDGIMDELRTQYGESVSMISLTVRPNGLIYLNCNVQNYQGNFLTNILTIIDSDTGEHRSIENMQLTGIQDVDGHEVLAYILDKPNEPEILGVRDLTTNQDIAFEGFFSVSLALSRLENFNLVYGMGESNVIYPIYTVDGKVIMEKWEFPEDSYITVYDDPMQNMLGIYFRNRSVEERGEIYSPFEEDMSSAQKWDYVFNEVIEVLGREGLAGEIVRSTVEIAYEEERLLEEPR